MYNEDDVVYTIIELSKFKSHSGYPFSLAFVYAEDKNYLIKGSSKEVESYIKNNLGFCHYNLSVYKNGKQSDCWKINHKKWRIVKDLQNGKTVYILEYNKIQKMILSRIPKKFMGELLNLTPNQHKG